MGEILFRGKRAASSEWVYGYYAYVGHTNKEKDYIIPSYASAFYGIEVVRATAGQYTGLKDKNGVEIYEGDILRVPPKNDYEKKNFASHEVFWHDNDCADRHIGWQMNREHYYGAIAGGNNFKMFLPMHTKNMVIIGNIHDNPELL